MQNTKDTTFCCFICCGTKPHATSHENIATARVPNSKKPLKSVLMHLAKFIKSELKVPPDACVCLRCYRDLVEYDDYVLKLLEVQQRLTKMIENSLNERRNAETVSYSSDDDGRDASMESLEFGPKHDDTDDDEEEELTLADIKAMTMVNLEPMDENEISLPGIEIKLETDEEQLELEIEVQKLASDLFEKSQPGTRRIRVPAACTHCNKVFKTKAMLSYHIKHKHKTVEKDGCTCTVCGVMVRDEEYLDLHMNLHEGKTEKECRYCNKQYTRKVNVIRHMQKHWDNKKFQCEKCGLRFSETTVLYNHKLVHEAEEEPLICAVCKQSFKTKRTYKGHMLTHRADRPRYSCEYCGKIFVEKYTLKVHLRVHEGGDGGASSGVLEPQEKHSHASAAVDGSLQESEEEAAKTAITTAPKCSLVCIICGCCNFTGKEHYNQHMQKQHDVILKM